MKYILVNKNKEVSAIYENDAALPAWRRNDVIPVENIPGKPALSGRDRAVLLYDPADGLSWKVIPGEKRYPKAEIKENN